MTEKVSHILAALEHPVELRFSAKPSAQRYRLSLYHHRLVAALQDPRARHVKISLQDTSVRLSYTPEDLPL